MRQPPWPFAEQLSLDPPAPLASWSVACCGAAARFCVSAFRNRATTLLKMPTNILTIAVSSCISLLTNTLFGNITMASLSLAGKRNARNICGLDRGTINNGLSSGQIHNNTAPVNKASLTPSPSATYSASAVKNVTHLCGLLAQQTAAPSKAITVPDTERLPLDLLA